MTGPHDPTGAVRAAVDQAAAGIGRWAGSGDSPVGQAALAGAVEALDRGSAELQRLRAWLVTELQDSRRRTEPGADR